MKTIVFFAALTGAVTMTLPAAAEGERIALGANRAAITDISLKAGARIRLSEAFSLPLFVQAIASPLRDHLYLVAGLGLAF